MKRVSKILMVGLFYLLSCGYQAFSQQSPNTITYKITYDASTQKYTVWVVPEYNVPNSYNPLATEKGATAQTTIALPSTVNITSITDINGVWQKPNTSGWIKFGPNEQPASFGGKGLDLNTSYYIIGKSPDQTDLGTFTNGNPVALYSFTTNSCAGAVRLISPTEPIINVGLNLNPGTTNFANSFYSLSGQPSGGNQNPLEQFRDVSGSSALCATAATIIANNDNATGTANTPVSMNVLANDLLNGVTPTNSTVDITIATNPTNGTAAVQSDGTIKYTPNAGFTGTDCYTYKICVKGSTTNCSTAQACVTIPSTTANTDLGITKTVNNASAALYDNLVYTLIVTNNGSQSASNINVSDPLSSNLQLISSNPSTYNSGTGIWNIPGPLAVGASTTLTIQAKVIGDGVITNIATITGFNGTDSNSSNNVASTCTSVPMMLCQGSSMNLNVPSNYTNVIWYKNGVQVGSGNNFVATADGTYTWTSSTVSTPCLNGCCPISIVTYNCCNTNICIPVTVQKIN